MLFASNAQVNTSSTDKMMDFDNILDIASQNQGVSNVQKRYSLQAGPSKRDPRSKSVNPSAVQALLKKRFHDTKKKEIELKKQKEALLAKRVELKSDRKARAMASRTKDNFKGYNGVPVLDSPTKRRTKVEMQEERAMNQDRFRNASVDPEDDEDNYEYEQSDSEPDQEPEPPRASKTIGSSVKSSSRKPSGPPKPPLAFADLLKLAEKKQHEPVELKPKTVKKEERPRTADEMRELELERKAKRQGKDRGTDRERDRSQPSSISVKKGIMERDQKGGRPQKNSIEKPSGSGRKPHQTKNMEKGHSAKTDRDKPRLSQKDRERPKMSLSGSSGAVSNKVSSKAASSSRMSAKQGPTMNSFSQKSSAPSDLKLKKESSSSLQRRASGTPSETGQKLQQGSTQQTRPSQGGSSRQGPPAGGRLPGKGEPVRPGMNSAVKTSVNSQIRPSSSRPPRAENHLEARPGATFRTKVNVPQVRPGGRAVHGPPGTTAIRAPGAGANRPVGGGPLPGRTTSNIGSGPGRPKCTVVSETISSKNVGGSRPVVPPRMGMPQRPGVPPRPGMPPRPMMNRPPGTMLPPITSAYKRKYEDEEEYDSEMDDFIDDGGEEQEEISRHIKEIFGYDRARYKDESDYALKFMESSWKEMQKEEAKSLRMAVHEDLEEERREQEELKRKAKRKKLN